MKAVVIHGHGGPEVLQYDTAFPDPKAGEGDVILRVKATSINYHDVFTRRGMPGIKLDFPVIMGLDVAGEIVEVGPGVQGWKAGDRVLVDPINRAEGGLMGETVHGGLAELCKAREHQLIRIPDGVSYEQAAALPVAFGTAYRMMNTIGQVQAGEKVLVLGASGGVGVGCVMLAKIAGAQVIACASSEAKMQRLRELGADHVINYADTDFAKAIYELYGKPHRRKFDGGVDVAVNFTGGDTWVKSMRCLRRGGRLLTCGATAGYDPQTDLRFIWTFELNIRGSNGWMREDLDALLGLVQSGKMQVPIDRVLSLQDAGEALRLIEDREVMGKVVVTP
ncbi:zinc-binding dehydrogenase [Bordetella bronchiseptica]|uniref:Chlorophyll synthesis pathway protein BchC n=3 Tax=Bordetella bronchiseptica TaxID=518 RepID=A0ABR4RK63_BORBO|nr:zinc-binding dehydrogenase [Bordetella bronchiseptica]KAK60644.1 putative chlorophyll synthesis pathway protein BchC [Bordetella bronchiseptica 980-2]SHQ18207.1 Zn-dependent alcohol dehydrogenase [Mycobacteroides abscessus subsp. abscessus]AMG86919.1 zinc-binding dehydrogenase [Bordetella bronchiseptica]AWP73249.1 zinc-binding dehydrogenase [Bordetella bronchiseptica]AWP78058.1 zinc-binding dehydrogenase [Bordetella bronchiseptica]